MQASFGDQYRNPIWVVGLMTDEIGAGRNSFQDFVELDAKRELRPGISTPRPLIRGQGCMKRSS
jgi:hypothetical protein